MNPIRINDYCFDRIHLWIQYDRKSIGFIEVVVEVFYPAARNAEGLVMFSHGFLIGNDPFFYLKKITGAFTGDNPLFGINPSQYYNYTQAIVEKNWAMAFVSASHLQFEGVPWLDFGGNPRVGQDAYAAASYLIKYGATDFFYKLDDHKRHSTKAFLEEIKKYRFMKPGCNNVIFAGHSVGGAHAQVAACGFDTMNKIGQQTGYTFDPVMYDREFLPRYSDRMSEWKDEERAKPVGLLQFSPVDQQIPLFAPGMQAYREALSQKPMPILMIVGECDCACLDSNAIQKPPAWSPDPSVTSQFSQLAPPGGSSWAVVANVERGSHCGYLTADSPLCSLADGQDQCKRSVGKNPYKACGEESVFSTMLLKELIGSCPVKSRKDPSVDGDFCDWLKSGCLNWLNKENPERILNMVPFPDGSYIDYSGKPNRCL